MVGYQFISRLFNLTELGAAYHPAWWQYFIFPVWFAAPFELLLGGAREPYYFILSMLALITPLLLMAAYIKLMPQFERNLQSWRSKAPVEKTRARSQSGSRAEYARNRQRRSSFGLLGP